ncbi:hypothetical protein [uncultured Pseudokineococcus sp.]|uniref:hypothetical protein n=1 Tax=uncultured Pseudokineococcus sp. TaxID=1642928 RepID=UPI00263123F9|nr:hypothetical protein [uncultured Pseudokineococcus sp.]
MLRRHPQLTSFAVVVLTVFGVRTVLDAVAPDLPWFAASAIAVLTAAVLGSVVARRLGAGSGDD